MYGIRRARNCTHFLVLVFMQNHWGMRWSCFCFWQKNHLILKVLGEDLAGLNATAQRMAEKRKMNVLQSLSYIFLAFIGGGLFFHFFSVWLPPWTSIFFVGFLEGLPSQNACSFLWPNSSFKSVTAFHIPAPQAPDAGFRIWICFYFACTSMSSLWKPSVKIRSRKNVNSNFSPSTH